MSLGRESRVLSQVSHRKDKWFVNAWNLNGSFFQRGQRTFSILFRLFRFSYNNVAVKVLPRSHTDDLTSSRICATILLLADTRIAYK